MDESIASLDFTALEVRVQAIMDDMKARGLSFRSTGKSNFSPTGRRFLDVEVVRFSGGSMYDKVWIDECPRRITDLRGTKAATANPAVDVLVPTTPKPGDNVKNLRLTVLKQRW